ncbi:MAG: hypothetical protein IPG04_17920 [Polyangiaceae bacterium]|nr:hypothetical protein [Polyangiaceae bacterium]
MRSTKSVPAEEGPLISFVRERLCTLLDETLLDPRFREGDIEAQEDAIDALRAGRVNAKMA